MRIHTLDSAIDAAYGRAAADGMRYTRARTMPRCSDCGFRVRGPNHLSGPHHLKLSTVTRKK